LTTGKEKTQNCGKGKCTKKIGHINLPIKGRGKKKGAKKNEARHKKRRAIEATERPIKSGKKKNAVRMRNRSKDGDRQEKKRTIKGRERHGKAPGKKKE